MRRVPKSRHAVAVAVFVVVSAIGGVFAALEDHLTIDQANMAVCVLRAENADLFRADPIFGDSELWRLHNPVWRWYLRQVSQATGGDVKTMFAAPVGPLVFVYLVGMYGLLWRQCRSWSTACFMAVLSTVVIPVAVGADWGLGPLATITPPTFVLAFTPLLLWALLARRDSASVLWVFLAIGLIGNVHVGSAMNLTVVGMIMLLAHARFSFRAILRAVCGGVCALCAVSPVLLYYATQRAAHAGVGPAMPSAAGLIDPAVALTGSLTLLGEVLQFPSLAYLLVLSIWAVAVIVRSERYRVRDLGAWVCMLIGVLVMSVGAQIRILTADSVGTVAAFAVALAHALRLALVPLYVLFAQGVVHLFRSGVPRYVLRVSLVIFGILWMVPSDNLAVPRHWVESVSVRALPTENRPANVQGRIERAARHEELQAVCRWLQANTSADTVVACTQGEVRLWAQRAMVVAWTDLPYYAYLAPADLQRWRDRQEAQNDVLTPRHGGPTDWASLAGFARRFGASYAILQPAFAPADAPQGARVPSPDQSWGEHWMLLRVRPANP